MSGECDQCGEHCFDCQCGPDDAFNIMTPDEEGWSEWIHPLPGYRMKCCDCGLVHELQVALTELHEAVSIANEGEDDKNIVVFRMRRAA